MSNTPGHESSALNPNDGIRPEQGSGAPPVPAPVGQAQPTEVLPETVADGLAAAQPTTQLPETLAAMPATPAAYPQAEASPELGQPVAQQFQPEQQFQPGQSFGQEQSFAPGQPFAQAQASQAPQMSTQTTASRPKNRSSMLLTGLALGALLGGVVGGGVSAIVASNVGQSQNATVQGSGTLTLSNGETATNISGVAAVATPSVVTLEVTGANASGSGSGVIYSEDGYIITNAHVVTLDGAAGTDASIRVKLSDGRILDGDVVGIDPYADLAVVKVEAESLPAVAIADSDNLNVGDLTVAIGAPMNLANTVTSGVISSVDRGISVGSPLIPQDQSQSDESQGDSGDGFPWDFRFGVPDEESQTQQQQQQTGGTVTLPVIQTDASINPGNSGGALLNGKGELIGINVAIASPTSSNGTASSAGLGFAIPSNLVTRVADALIAGEQPSHGLLGASIADSSQDTDADANHAGGLIVDLERGGAAEAAGLKAGDVITAVDGVPAADGTSVSALIRMHEGGSEVTLSYTRDGVAGETTAKLGQLEW